MKRQFLFIVFAVCGFTAVSQPIITTSNMPVSGSKGAIYEMFDAYPQTTISEGSNQSWDLSNRPYQKKKLYECRDASTMSQSSRDTFPGVTHLLIVKDTPTAGYNDYRHYEIRTSGYYYLGNSDGYKSIYKPDTADVVFTNGANLGSVQNTSKYVLTYAGWGKLKTPVDSASDVALFKKKIKGDNNTYYEFFICTPKYRKLASIKVNDDGYSESEEYWTFYPATVGMEEQATSLKKIFPNPAASTVNLQHNFTQMEELTIINMYGEVVYKETLLPNQTQTTINVSIFPKGMYLVKIGGRSEKLVVE